ncbi:uncharacterized protein LOC110914039 [Helianthus annuus]|uniref:uncharacterized protein LOC110914039 n=1 Tax=Helianthus annuus TaxID=4232 RepID=UPI000B8F5744|nr:uncharacterized protein LOC110914039 [Helianthus annuus]
MLVVEQVLEVEQQGIAALVIMPPRFLRGRGKGPVSGHDHEAGPSHRRTPSITMSTSLQEPWRLYIEPGRRSVSLSSSPSYQHSFGPHSENEPNNQPPAFIPLQRSNSHHSFGDPTPVFQSRFNPANLLPEPVGFNPLGPEDHFSGENDMDEDTDPVEPASGTPNHPIEISDGSSFHGSPYRGPDSFMEKFNQYDWYFTPSEHSHHEQQQDPSVDPYQVARDYNALHPEGPYGGPWTTGYPTYGYQHQPPPPPVYQPPQPQIQQEVLERLNQVEQEVREDRRERQGFFKRLSDLLKGKSKRRGH